MDSRDSAYTCTELENDELVSIHSYFCCTDCKVSLWLGKAVFTGIDRTKVVRYHVGSAASPPNHEDKQLTMAIWKMLADHQGHGIHTYFDYEFDVLPDRSDYREIGGDCENCIPFDAYLEGWGESLENE